MFKAQDVLVVVQLSADRRRWTVASLAESLQLPHATVQRSLERCSQIGFFDGDRSRIDPYMVEEFLIHAVRFGFPAKLGDVTKGVPTAWSALPMASHLRIAGDDAVVWPSADGRRKGRGLLPIHPVLPSLGRSNPTVYKWVTLVDAIRTGRAREREVASELLVEMIDSALALAA